MAAGGICVTVLRELRVLLHDRRDRLLWLLRKRGGHVEVTGKAIWCVVDG